MVMLCSSGITRHPTKRYRLRICVMLRIFTSAGSEEPGRSRFHLAMLSGQEVILEASDCCLQRCGLALPRHCWSATMPLFDSLSASTAARAGISSSAIFVRRAMAASNTFWPTSIGCHTDAAWHHLRAL